MVVFKFELAHFFSISMCSRFSMKFMKFRRHFFLFTSNTVIFKY
jgi:hypothetical protein